jgi:hypothetical protein
MPLSFFSRQFVKPKHKQKRRPKVEKLQLVLVILQIIEAILKLLSK